MSKPIPKKITELDKISDISLDDLLLVSDYEGGKCLSKRMTMQQLVNYIILKVKSSSVVNNQIKQIATNVFNENIDDGVVQVVKDNTEQIVSALSVDLVAADVFDSKIENGVVLSIQDNHEQIAEILGVEQIATNVFNENIDEGVVQGIKDNTDLIVDLLDKVEDGQVLIDSGGAGELGPEEDELEEGD